MWSLWWTKWHWYRFSPSTSVSTASHHSTNFSIIIITRGWLYRPLGGRSAEWTQLDSTAPIPIKKIKALKYRITIMKISAVGDDVSLSALATRYCNIVLPLWRYLQLVMKLAYLLLPQGTVISYYYNDNICSWRSCLLINSNGMFLSIMLLVMILSAAGVDVSLLALPVSYGDATLSNRILSCGIAILYYLRDNICSWCCCLRGRR
jgi:hypothetical protein